MAAGMISGLELLKLFLGTAFVYLPFGLIFGMVSFIFFRWLLKFKHPVIAVIAKLAMLLSSFALIIGVLYGSLRFGGVIIYPSDNTISWNWFDASWRDDGFGHIYPCGCVLIGMASAVLAEWSARRDAEGAASVTRIDGRSCQ